VIRLAAARHRDENVHRAKELANEDARFDRVFRRRQDETAERLARDCADDTLLLSAQSIEQVLVNGRQYEALAAIDSLPAFG
jgi:hypothetical protein